MIGLLEYCLALDVGNSTDGVKKKAVEFLSNRLRRMREHTVMYLNSETAGPGETAVWRAQHVKAIMLAYPIPEL